MALPIITSLLTAANISATAGTITTLAATTANLTTANITTGNVTTNNVTTGNIATANVSSNLGVGRNTVGSYLILGRLGAGHTVAMSIESSVGSQLFGISNTGGVEIAGDLDVALDATILGGLSVSNTIATLSSISGGSIAVTGNSTAGGVGDFGTTHTNSDGLRVRRNSNTVGHQAGVDFYLRNASDAAKVYGGVYAAIEGNSAAAENGQLHFYVVSTGTATKRAYIDSIGHLHLTDGGLWSDKAASHLQLSPQATAGYGIALNTYQSGAYRALTLVRTALTTYSLFETSTSPFLLNFNNTSTGAFNVAIKTSLAVGQITEAGAGLTADINGILRADGYKSNDGSNGVPAGPIRVFDHNSASDYYDMQWKDGILIQCDLVS